MTWREIIWIAIIMGVAFLLMAIRSKYLSMRAKEERIYQEEIERTLEKITADITPTLLEQYGFKIYDTKDVTYAVKGGISMTQKDGYWETEIQAPGKILWRDTHDQIGSLIIFCEKHGVELTKKEDSNE